MERSSDLFEDQIAQTFYASGSNPASSNNSEHNSAAAAVTKKPDALTLWTSIQTAVSSNINENAFAAWIKPLKITALHYSSEFYSNQPTNGEHPDAEVIIAAPNKFSKDHVLDKYGAAIKAAAAQLLGSTNILVVIKVDVLDDNKTAAAAKQAPRKQPVAAKQDPDKFLETNLNPRSNFSNFVVGDCNQFAHAVSIQVTNGLGNVYNPLFIYGGVGLGKTHLANAIGNAAHRRGKKVLLVSSEAFVSELISSLRNNNITAFKSKFRSLDLLIIDDIQFIIGKEKTEEEFFHTFNELHQRHKQIVITSDKVPQDLIGLEDRLKTRFASGITVDLQAPDFETRVAILSKKAEILGSPIPEAVARLIADKVKSNVRELEGMLNKLLALASLHNSKIDTDLANKVLASIIPKSSRDITADLVQQVVAKRFSVGINDLTGKRRTQNIAHARQVAMYLCRKLTPRSYPEIGAAFGGRDHSTVIHAKKVIEEKMNTASFLNEILEIEKEITA